MEQISIESCQHKWSSFCGGDDDRDVQTRKKTGKLFYSHVNAMAALMQVSYIFALIEPPLY